MHACPAAAEHGVRLGMSLAEAKALCPLLAHADHDADADRRGIEAVGRWLMQFSPTVAIEHPDALLLDVTGSERLFGGMNSLLVLARTAITKLRLSHRIAIAPTPGAAWAIASYGRDETSVLRINDLEDVLNPLPVVALRVGNDMAAVLFGLGIETIEQLVRLPRQTLPSRFGAILLTRIDEAFGRLVEPLIPITTAIKIRTSVEFDCALQSLETIWAALKLLLERVLVPLSKMNCGVRGMRVEFFCEKAVTIDLTISLSRPTRDSTTLLNLLHSAVETAKTRSGFVGIALSVPIYEKVTDEQLDLLDREQQIAEAELDDLIQRLRVRLGEDSVLSVRLREFYQPEHSYQFRKTNHINTAIKDGVLPLPRARPLHLLPSPVEVRCMLALAVEGNSLPMSFTLEGCIHQVTHLNGPERIGGQWWKGRDKTRDYYDVEDQSGRRFWLFHVLETGKWYLHGLFD